MIKLGEEVKCVITGFKGIATSRIEYINGCTQYGIKSKIEKGKAYPDTVYLDEQQLEVINKKKPVIKKSRNGGPELIKNESTL